MCKVEIQLILNILFLMLFIFVFFIYQCLYNKPTMPDITEILLKVALNTTNPTLVVEIFLLYSC